MNDRTNLQEALSISGTEHVNTSYMRRKTIVCCLLLAIITLGIYWQTLSHDFITLDDNLYVTENGHVQKGLIGDSIKWAFTSFHAGNWHPLTWLSHMADVELFGLNPRGHHLTSIIIHVFCSCSLFILLVQCTAKPWRSLFVSALFAIHPLHVESVAWISERKDVLCSFFWMMTLLFYYRYLNALTFRYYLLSLFFFCLALMAKPMAVTLPMVLFLMDYWLCRFSPHQLSHTGFNSFSASSALLRMAAEKSPFFILSLIFGMVTFHAQQKWSYVVQLDSLPFGIRLENAIVAYGSYIRKMIWPSNLAIIYPYSRSLPLWQTVSSLALLSGVTFLTYKYRKQSPYLLVGWLWFLITLLPVIGLIQVGSQAMADRYTYIPHIGLFIMITWGISDLFRGWNHGNTLLTGLATGILLAMAIVTERQAGHWKDSGSIYEHALKVTTDNYIAHNNLGMYVRLQGRNHEALHHFLRSVDINQNYATAHFNLGLTFYALGNKGAATSHLQTALLIDPEDKEARQYLDYIHNTGD